MWIDQIEKLENKLLKLKKKLLSNAAMHVSQPQYIDDRYIYVKNLVKEVGKEAKVHWLFECGCEYKGPRYLWYGRKQCKIHKEPAAFEEIFCPCGKSFWIFTNGRSPVLCDDCIENNKIAWTKEMAIIDKKT